MNARTRILARLNAAPRRALAVPAVDAWYQEHTSGPDHGPGGLRADFEAALRASHAEVLGVGRATWPGFLCAWLLQRGLHRVWVADPALRAELQAGASLASGDQALTSAPEGCAVSAPAQAETLQWEWLEFAGPFASWKAELFATVQVGVSRAHSALAQTGTLVLRSSPHEPRTQSLVPPVHVVLVDERSLHPHLHAACRAEQWAAGLPTNLIMISGPSKTADIQQTLAYGAHGPRELLVLVLEGETRS